MGTFTETITHTFNVVSCYTCSAYFAITSSLYRRVVTKAEGSVYCPSCGNQTYWGESDEKKKIKQLETELRHKQVQIDREKQQTRIAKDQRDKSRKSHSKMRERVKNGVCPCCSRSFENLLRHMKTKHPEYGKDMQLRQVREAYGMTQQQIAEEIGIDKSHVSLFENEKPLTNWASDMIEAWLTQESS